MSRPIVEESEKQLLMLFRLAVRLRPGRSIFDQVVYVAKKALLSGEFRRGQLFPSVRALATELKIHRNTAHTRLSARPFDSPCFPAPFPSVPPRLSP